MLDDEGLIEVRITGGERYVSVSQLNDLERYARMYYDLSINVPGIDAIQHLLQQMEEMRREIRQLHARLNLYGREWNEEIE